MTEYETLLINYRYNWLATNKKSIFLFWELSPRNTQIVLFIFCNSQNILHRIRSKAVDGLIETNDQYFVH